MKWVAIESGREFVLNPKVICLAARLGMRPVTAGGHLVAMWAWAAEHNEDGIVTSWTAAHTAAAACFEGDPHGFRTILEQEGWIDVGRDGTAVLHDWLERQGAVLQKRLLGGGKKKEWKQLVALYERVRAEATLHRRKQTKIESLEAIGPPIGSPIGLPIGPPIGSPPSPSPNPAPGEREKTSPSLPSPNPNTIKPPESTLIDDTNLDGITRLLWSQLPTGPGGYGWHSGNINRWAAACGQVLADEAIPGYRWRKVRVFITWANEQGWDLADKALQLKGREFLKLWEEHCFRNPAPDLPCDVCMRLAVDPYADNCRVCGAARPEDSKEKETQDAESDDRE